MQSMCCESSVGSRHLISFRLAREGCDVLILPHLPAGRGGDHPIQIRGKEAPIDAAPHRLPACGRGLQPCLHILCNPGLQV